VPGRVGGRTRARSRARRGAFSAPRESSRARGQVIPAAASAFRDDDNDGRNDGGMGAADGLLINGGVNNGAASLRAGARSAITPGGRGLYSGGFALLGSNSAFDSRQYSFTSQPAPKQDYNDCSSSPTSAADQDPRLMRRGPNFFGYQHQVSTSEAGLLPTLIGARAASRVAPAPSASGAGGRSRHRPAVSGNIIPADRITPQATSLLGYYPRPNAVASNQPPTPIIVKTRRDSGQRASRTSSGTDASVFRGRFSISATIGRPICSPFVDTTQTTGLNVDINHSHRLNQFMFLGRYQGQAPDQRRDAPSRTSPTSRERRHPRQRSDPVNWGRPR
jgi:hypothetical protein